MKPNALTGTFALKDDLALGAATTRTQLLSSQIGKNAKVLIQDEPWCSFRFTVSLPNLVATYFKGEALESIHIAVMDVDPNKAEWSTESEIARKKANNNWLTSVGLNPGSYYSWGSVWSDYDPRSGSSSIVIRYTSAANPIIQTLDFES